MINRPYVLKLMLSMLIMMISVSGVAAQEVEMATALHENGKIYIVVAVVCIIFSGIVTYLILLDRKISDLEKRIKK